MAISIRKGPSNPACSISLSVGRVRASEACEAAPGWGRYDCQRPGSWPAPGLFRAGCSCREPPHLAGGGAVSLLAAADERQRAAPRRQRGSHLVCSTRQDGGS